MTPQAHVFKYLVSHWRHCLGEVGALLEEVPHWGQALTWVLVLVLA